MTWSVLQSNGNNSSTGGNTIQYASNVSSGTVLLCAVSAFQATVTAVKDAALNAFTQVGIFNFANTAGAGTLSLWALATPAGDVGTRPVLTATGTGTFLSMVIQEVSGIQASVDGTAAFSSGASPVNAACGAYSTTAANEYLVALYGDDSNVNNATAGTPTGSTTYTLDANSQQANGSGCLGFAYGNSTHGSETATFPITNGSGNDYATIFIAFKLSAAPSSPAGQVPALMAARTEVISRAAGRVVRL